jgi:hypothetical protein
MNGIEPPRNAARAAESNGRDDDSLPRHPAAQPSFGGNHHGFAAADGLLHRRAANLEPNGTARADIVDP